MLALALNPAVLAALVLAAHFLRRGQIVSCALCVAAAALVAVRATWARRALQVFLAAATLVWVRSSLQLVSARRAEGGSVVRLVVILGAVTLVTLVAALLLELPRARRHFATPPRA